MTPEEQNDYLRKPDIDENYIIRFGKYKDNPMAIKDIPASYFLYLYSRDICYGALKDYIKYNKAALEERDKVEKAEGKKK